MLVLLLSSKSNLRMNYNNRLFDFAYYQLQNYPQTVSFSGKDSGNWISYSTEELIDTFECFGLGLLELGLERGDKVALISNNRPEWVISDLGILSSGCIDVPIYPTITEEDYEYIFNNAEIKLCFVSDEELYNKVNSIKAKVPTLQAIYSYNELSGVRNWKEIVELGRDKDRKRLREIQDSIKPEDLATLIYTSGTTGVPKGVMLSHRNIVSNAIASKERLPVNENAISLSFLPVCHIYERMLIYLYTYTGVSVYFARSIDTIGEDLKEVKPHVFTAVPRLLEKVYDKIMAKGAELSGIKKALFFWAVGLAEDYEPYGKNGGFYEFKLKIARKLIFSKWQEALGGRAQAVASGSAALQARLARIFLAAGVPVMEGYGLTESSPVISVNCEENYGLRIGSVGKILRDVEVKIAADGEILAKGPNIMMGYYKMPEKTAEVIDSEGWLHTGDIGEIDSDGFLKITDRKKEMFKTSGGKYVAPQVLENKFKASRFIEQVMVVGEGQKHPSALVMPAKDFVLEWAKRHSIAFSDYKGLCSNETLVSRIWKEIDEINQGFGKWEQVKKISVVSDTWGVDTGELTPTLKLKRKVIYAKYKTEIEEFYS